MNNFKPTFYNNIDNIVGEQDSFRISIDYDGNLVLLTQKEEKGKYLHKVFHFVNNETRIMEIPNVSYPYAFAQPIDENWLLVSSRIGKDESLIKNATIYDVQGNVLDTFTIGDAIEDVQTTKKSDIWVSYYDESSDYSLSCFNKQGALIIDFIDFVKQSNNEIPYIDDCYALNVTSDESVYTYYYSDFPLVKIEKDNFEIFNNIPVKGSHAFAIMNNFVLFNKGYNEEGKIHLYSINNKCLQSFNLLNLKGEILNYDDSVARGNKFYFAKDKDIYLLKLEDILNSFRVNKYIL